ncbi:MAG: cytochrome b/b6 domain-containing protein [Terriglobales bacterium]
MGDSVCVPIAAPAVADTTVPLRHSALVRVTHWITALCFLALLVSGAEIVLSHPRFYWGETGNDLTQPLFKLPLPASRKLVPTGYAYVLPDQNGWSRYLHFQAAWIVVFTGLLYVISILFAGHLRQNLLPVWTGLAMSPAFVSVFPATVDVLGGQQSARTLHFFVSLALLLFLLVHVVMVCLAGFKSRMRAMIMGRATAPMERT